MSNIILCAISGCEKTAKSRGWCQRHYDLWRRNGDPLIDLRPELHMTVEDRFWMKVERTDTCWRWTGSRTGGYGRFRLDGKTVTAHRFAYELLVGPIPEGLVIDHTCGLKRCVNPDHLEPVTFEENVRRGSGPTANNGRKTHCLRGHPLSGENLYMYSARRICKTCHRERLARNNLD